jgi:endoglucanase
MKALPMKICKRSRVNLTRRSLIVGTLALTAADWTHRGRVAGRAHAGAAPNHGLPAGGVNLAGADFGEVPGTHGKEYLYPSRKHIDYYRGLGFDIVRLPFKWERLQPQVNGAFAAGEQNLLVDLVTYATSTGVQIILDPHNYAKRRVPDDDWKIEHGIGAAAVPPSAFSDFWVRLSELFKHDDRVVFGLMNEPVGLKPAPWLEIVNGTIAAIRATGAKNLILVPGVEYTGAHSWFAVGNDAMAGVVDPTGRFAFDVHQYFDGNSSGTQPDAVSGTIGSERIQPFQDWARKHGFKAVLGEFCGGRNAASYNALHDICQEMSANSDVWLGWAAWAGGPRWPESDMFNLEPWTDGRVREQTAILAQYARPASQDFWVRPGAAIDLDLARDRLFGAAHFDEVLAGPPGRPEVNAFAVTRKGLRTDASRISIAGPMMSLLHRPTFTLVIEIEGLPDDQGAADILGSANGVMLRRAADGAVETAFGTSLRTAPQSPRNWRARRKVVIAIHRAAGRIAIAATGAKAVVSTAAIPEFGVAIVGGEGPTALRGFITRITGYADFRAPAALDDLVA